MPRFFIKRIGLLLFTMLVVSFLVFTVNEFSPGQVARKILGPYATQLQVDMLTEQMGLNRPVIVRYFEWIGNVLTGGLGCSTLFKVPVSAIIFDRIGNTLVLAAIAFAVIVPSSIVLGVAAGMREASRLDRTISLASIITT